MTCVRPSQFSLLSKLLNVTSQAYSLNVMSKMNDFWRLQAVAYTAKVEICCKWYRIETLLLQITNRTWHVAYRIAPFLMTVSDLGGHSPIASLSKYIFFTVVQLLQNYKKCIVVNSTEQTSSIFSFIWMQLLKPREGACGQWNFAPTKPSYPILNWQVPSNTGWPENWL